jgi:hypothetical protein
VRLLNEWAGRLAAALLLLAPLCLAGCRLEGAPPQSNGATQPAPTQTATTRTTATGSAPAHQAEATPTPSGAAAPAEPVAEVFRPLLARLKKESGVPVLLPSEMPAWTAGRKVYVEGAGKPDGYLLTLTSTPRCGANACTVGYFEAKRGGAPYSEKRVRLARGVEGFYEPLTCGGSCTPPTVEWVAGGVLYTIQLDVAGKERLGAEEEQRRLLRVADSAIDAGPR